MNWLQLNCLQLKLEDPSDQDPIGFSQILKTIFDGKTSKI